MIRVAAMVDTTSDSPRWCRPTTPAAAFDVENGVCLQAVSMMSVDVYARNRGYGSTIGTRSPRTLTVGVRASAAHAYSKRRREPPAIDVYERCLLGVFQPVVCASSVERPVPRAVDLSYLSIPGPG